MLCVRPAGKRAEHQLSQLLLWTSESARRPAPATWFGRPSGILTERLHVLTRIYGRDRPPAKQQEATTADSTAQGKKKN